uniref:Riboflavin transporter n=1 Tax=Acrobeloides nanus TaxID=290746 RepID=A0A914EKT1_9BILA
MQLPLLTEELPEKWNLPSYLTVIVQLASIGPLLYSILHKCTNLTIPTAPVIQVLLIICTATNFVLAFTCKTTGIIFGQEHSIALIAVMFFMALVNSTSNVLFLPYMATFQPGYLTAYFVGMGLSALVPSLFSLIQGTSRYECRLDNSTGTHYAYYFQPRFGVKEYNLILFGWMCLTVLAFAFLHWGRHLLDKRATKRASIDILPPDESSPLNNPHIEAEDRRDSLSRYYILLACLAIICAQMNGIVPSIQSFATLPYSQLTYHLALTLSNIAQPVACFLPLWIQPRKLPILLVLTSVSCIFCGIIVLLAAQSPTPLLHLSFWGGFISVAAAVGASSVQAYLRTVFTAVIREDSPHNDSRLFWCGVFMQIGSFLGSLIMFPLVNIVGLFHQAPSPCSHL